MDEHPGWPEYLDALETYLDEVSRSVEDKQMTSLPVLAAAQPAGPVPVEELLRAHVLLDRAEAASLGAERWMAELEPAKRLLQARRLNKTRPAGRIHSVL